ncbi:MAG: LytR C-terminal domain-containing protein [Acidimicrobiales bacterium]
MTTARGAQPQPPRGGGPESPPAWSLGKAIGVAVVAVALGAYLVALGGGPHSPASAASHAASTSAPAKPTTSQPTTSQPTTSQPPTTKPPTTSSTPSGASSTARPSGTVKVLVANASQTNGVAAYYSGKLAAAGWGTLTPTTATTAEASSTIYYATGQQQDALAIAAALGIPSSSVHPLASSIVPVLSATQAGVVVVAGNDLAAKVPPAGAG